MYRAGQKCQSVREDLSGDVKHHSLEDLLVANSLLIGLIYFIYSTRISVYKL